MRMRRKLPLLLVGCLFALPQVSRGADPAPAADSPPAAAPATKPAGDAAKALAEYKAMKPPTVDMAKRGDREYVQSYIKQMQGFMKQRAERAKEFATRYPDHPQAGKLMLERWNALAQLGESAPVLAETKTALAEHPDSADKTDILFFRAVASLRAEGDEASAAKDAVDAFVKAAPKDERSPMLLAQLAQAEPDVKKQAELNRRIVEQYPDSQAAEAAKGALQQLDAVGKPFELSFTDAIGGKPVSIKDLKGKVVVVDFWATWCGPCVGEMPHMKELYAKYKPQGVEFIGVSLDQPEAEGGLKALKGFVQENGIGWPQYYQGNGWESEFSKKWGVDSIPRVFVVDAEGKLYSPDARGKLEKLIPELLKGHAGGDGGKVKE